MASHKKTLHLTASKLGLSGNDKVLGKAAEFERLLQTKTMAGSNISDTSKVVICLDLAAGLLGADIDLETAIKYSGLKLSMYHKSRKIIENLLELDSNKLTTSIICAALQCPSVQTLADTILEKYQKLAKMEIDLNLPQYVCMAVYQACRISNVKVSKVKIKEKSRLKPAQWVKLDAEWAKFVDEQCAGPVKKRGRPHKTTQVTEPEKMDIDEPQIEKFTEPEIEPYAVWKRRMLETAYNELKVLEELEAKQENQIIETKKLEANKLHAKKEEIKVHEKKMTPRRSPRKTPQKYSPYKSPEKSKGVRLLFPREN